MPDPIDWVKRRHECSIDLVFVRLRDQVEKDVAARNELRQERGETSFKFRCEIEDGNFMVILEGQQRFDGVKFVRSKDAIAVHQLKSDKLISEATLTLSDEGECKLKVSGKELDLWQFRMKALEDLFFAKTGP
jgi:hypothetical protein